MIGKTINVIKRLIQVLTKAQRRLFWLVLVGAVLSAICETLSVSVIIPLVNALLEPEKMLEQVWFKPIATVFNVETKNDIIIVVIGGTIGVYIIKNFYMVFFSWVKAKYASKIQKECSVYMAQSYMNRGYKYFLNVNPNDIFQGVVPDVQGVYNIINSLLYIITKSLIVIMIGLFMFISDWLMAVGLMCAAGICLLILIYGFKKPMKIVGENVRDYTISANKVLFQFIYGVKEVLVMRKQQEFVEDFNYNMGLRQKEDIKRSVSTDAPNYIVEAFCISAIMIVLCVRMITTPDSTAFIAVLASFAVAAFRILPAVGYISSAFNNVISNLASLNEVYDNMIEAKKYNNEFDDVNATDKEEYKDHEFAEGISVNDVTFSYDENSKLILDHINLEIKKNQSVALVGESGAGKSTLADVILGILPVNSGNVKLDGIDVKDIPILWSKLIGFVPQSIYLCDSSIKENVAFGLRPENIDEARVRKVLEMANVLSFIDTLPKGIDTVVGDHGVRLSGGQRQRIGIARALYHNPEILILDEATSALDNETEQSVMEAIESLQGNITMIIIAHRLTTVKKCDRIYEIAAGKAVERRYEDIV